MTIDDIIEDDIEFASMVIGYKIYYSIRMKSIFGTIVYASYEMMRENKKCVLCQLHCSELIKNIKRSKKIRNILSSLKP